MGSPDFSVPSLDRLYSDGHEICLVVTQPDRPRGRSSRPIPCAVAEKARSLNLEIFQPERLKRSETINQILEFEPAALIVVAYGKILPTRLFATPPLGAINVHASILPHFRGAAPIARAIAAGKRETGVSLMQIEKGLDTGDVYSTRTCPIDDEDTTATLTARLSELGAECLGDSLPHIASGDLLSAPQVGEATLAPPLEKEEGRIDWNQDAFEIRNRIRAFDPWPGSRTTLRETSLAIWHGRAARPDSAMNEVPGTIVSVSPESISIACGMSTILVADSFQPAGKRRLDARAFLNGYRPRVGECFS